MFPNLIFLLLMLSPPCLPSSLPPLPVMQCPVGLTLDSAFFFSVAQGDEASVVSRYFYVTYGAVDTINHEVESFDIGCYTSIAVVSETTSLIFLGREPVKIALSTGNFHSGFLNLCWKRGFVHMKRFFPIIKHAVYENIPQFEFFKSGVKFVIFIAIFCFSPKIPHFRMSNSPNLALFLTWSLTTG